MRREFLQLAKTYKPGANVAGWFISEKCDGTRCFWDGGLSRGLPTESVPYASILDPKTGLKKAKIKPIATGLWSRYGNPIMAPDWFLNQLPACPLDGELWAGRGKFQLCRSICGGDAPDPRFDQLVYAVYSSPPLGAVFKNGTIKNSNMLAELEYTEILRWIRRRLTEFDGDYRHLLPAHNFADELQFLQAALDNGHGSPCYLHQQVKLIDIPGEAAKQVDTYLDKVLDQGGEGVVIRDPNASWMPKRVGSLLKYKPFLDDEAVITGFTSGRETDKGSKHLGKIGALITTFHGKRLELSGLTDEEREFANPDYSAKAAVDPGRDMPFYFQGKHFRTGQIVTFKYRELSDDGIPKEARYWRNRSVE